VNAGYFLMADDNGAEKTYYVDRDMPALIVKMG